VPLLPILQYRPSAGVGGQGLESSEELWLNTPSPFCIHHIESAWAERQVDLYFTHPGKPGWGQWAPGREPSVSKDSGCENLCTSRGLHYPSIRTAMPLVTGYSGCFIVPPHEKRCMLLGVALIMTLCVQNRVRWGTSACLKS
jgi:hypothetical protein